MQTGGVKPLSLAIIRMLSDPPVGSRGRTRVKINVCARLARLWGQMFAQIRTEVLHEGNASDVTAIYMNKLSKADMSR